METEKRLIDANALMQKARWMEEPDGNGINVDIMAVSTIAIEEAPTVDAVEVVHSRFVRIADFGDGEGCFGYCEKCGTVHHAQSPVALKAEHRWCRWCGAKMDGDGNA